MSDFAWRPLVKQMGLASGTVPPFMSILLLKKGVNLLLGLTLMMKLLRSPSLYLPLSWLKGLKCQAVRSWGQSKPLSYEVGCRVDVRFGSPFSRYFPGSAFGSIGRLGYCCCSYSSDSSFFACSRGFCFSAHCGYYASLFGYSCRGSCFHHWYPFAQCWCDSHECFRKATSFFFSFTSSYFDYFGIGVAFLLFSP